NTPGTGTPYIDFHFGPKAAEDFNVRLINDANGTLSIQGKVLQVTGSAGIGTPTPGARLTIQQGSTPAGSAANGKGLFVSALMGTGAASDGGIEFRHDNLSQGIGFGFNTIYATGSNADQPLGLNSRGNSPLTLNTSNGTHVLIGKNPTGITSKWTGIPDGATNGAEIANDVDNYKTLMIVGNKANDGKTRTVGIWDQLTVNGNETVTGALTVQGGLNVN